MGVEEGHTASGSLAGGGGIHMQMEISESGCFYCPGLYVILEPTPQDPALAMDLPLHHSRPPLRPSGPTRDSCLLPLIKSQGPC